MSRIATRASNDHMLDLIDRTRRRVEDLQAQVVTGKKSESYAGIASDARELIDLENRNRMLEQFQHNNSLVKMRLEVVATTVDGIGNTLRKFKETLDIVASGQPLNTQQATDLQEEAFRVLRNVQDYLNTDLDGRYLFSGSAVRTAPVRPAYASLQELQAIYDGEKTVFPPTEAAQVGRRGTLTAAETGTLTITGTDTITIATGAFQGIAPGTTIQMASTAIPANNARSFTVTDVDPAGTWIKINGAVSGVTGLTVNNTIANGTDASATLTIVNWYQGNELAQTHRLDEERSFTLDLDAIHPGFEKALRALGIIAQGQAGTPGALEQHLERIQQASDLLDSALNRAPTGNLPVGSEKPGSVDDVAMDLGFQLATLKETSVVHANFSKALTERVAELENTDTSEAITLLLDNTRALEASYQVMSRVQRLSLTNYI